jgi:hypothetical protein
MCVQRGAKDQRYYFCEREDVFVRVAKRLLKLLKKDGQAFFAHECYTGIYTCVAWIGSASHARPVAVIDGLARRKAYIPSSLVSFKETAILGMQ